MNGALRGGALGALGLVALCVSSCRTQRWPGPMESLVTPLPAGDLSEFEPGPEEVTIWRHADPVFLRRSGTTSAFPLRFYDRKHSLLSGGMMGVGDGGRGEVLWDDGTSILLLGRGVVLVGEPSRGEPDLVFRWVSNARLLLGPEVEVELPGGARLRGNPDTEQLSGPFLLETMRSDVLRLRNQSRGPATLRYRDATIDLGPAELIDLALLDDTAPREAETGWQAYGGPALDLRGSNSLVAEYGEESLTLASPEGSLGAEFEGLGVRVRLEPGESVVFSGLGPADALTQPPPIPPPAPEPDPEAAPEGDPDGEGSETTDPAETTGPDETPAPPAATGGDEPAPESGTPPAEAESTPVTPPAEEDPESTTPPESPPPPSEDPR